MQALTLHVSGKMQHLLIFLKPIFDYQVIFKKYMMFWSRMYWSHDLMIYYLTLIWVAFLAVHFEVGGGE